ncbi:MAG: RNA polymerase sigma factor RpoE [Gammaproteobacteria bacterium]|jgi:RNA polymerase sigma-70 factor (ECF subfamily)
MQANSTDLVLIQAIQHGNRNAFGLLVTKYQHRILRLIKRYVPDSHESLDVMQEIFIKAYKAIDHFRKESSFYTWLYKIAINTAKTYLIDKNRHFPDFSFDILESEQLVSIIKTNLKEYNAPDNLILRGELENIFFSLISKLPEELKVTIKLREVDELTYEEIALIMECPVGTVRSRIFRAREAIEKKITNKKVLH